MALIRCSSGGGSSINMQSGEVTETNMPSVTWKTTVVTFDTPFSTKPKVYARAKGPTGDYGDTSYVVASATNISTTGFTLYAIQGYTGSGSRTCTFEWIAFTD